MIVQTYPVTVLYDESCPLCKLEIDNLRSRNQDGRLAFVDVSAADYDVARYQVPLADLMAIIHAVKADGSIVNGVEVFRLAYTAVGLGWIMRPTGWPLLQPMFDYLYRWFAAHRQGISKTFGWLLRGVAARRASRRVNQCKQGSCEI